MTSSILTDAWELMESEGDSAPGLYERRLVSQSGLPVFAGLVRPGLQLRLLVDVPPAIQTTGLERETAGFRVQRQYNAAQRVTRVSLELVNARFKELFAIVADDIAGRILNASDESGAIAIMRERLNHWERFMRAAGTEGLSREDQIGLFGELTFIRALLETAISPVIIVASWRGPSGANQDFLVGNNALEIKTTTGNTATAAVVSNELQLDDSECGRLFLLHLWLKELQHDGTSLPDLVDEIGNILVGSAADAFADLIVEAGYHTAQRGLYEEIGYVERARRYYVVERDFPRIRVADLRAGVRKVKYEIDMSGFGSYMQPESLVINALMGLQQ